MHRVMMTAADCATPSRCACTPCSREWPTAFVVNGYRGITSRSKSPPPTSAAPWPPSTTAPPFRWSSAPDPASQNQNRNESLVHRHWDRVIQPTFALPRGCRSLVCPPHAKSLRKSKDTESRCQTFQSYWDRESAPSQTGCPSLAARQEQQAQASSWAAGTRFRRRREKRQGEPPVPLIAGQPATHPRPRPRIGRASTQPDPAREP